MSVLPVNAPPAVRRTAGQGPPAPRSSPPGPYGRGLRFAALAYPVVQGVRFVTKALLAWFVAVETFGTLMLASLLVFLVQQVAQLGLPEALVAAGELGAERRRTLTRRIRRAGRIGSSCAFAGGLALALSHPVPELGVWMLALAPTVAFANFALLPTARLVRARAHRALFAIDVRAILAFAATTIGLGVLGAGGWSVIAGWYAQHLVQWLAAVQRERALPPESARSVDLERVHHHGRQLLGARLLEISADRLDGLVTGFLLGPWLLGLYELASHLSTFALHALRSMAERALLPTLAAENRTRRLGITYLEAQRLVLCFLVPLHVVLAVVAAPLVLAFFPAGFALAGPLLGILAIAALVRCFESIATTALKAAERGRATMAVALARVLVLAGLVLLAVPTGDPRAIALAVLGARGFSTLLALGLVQRDLGDRAARLCPNLRASAWSIATWVFVLATSIASVERLGLHVTTLVFVVPLLGAAAWLAIRWVGDPEALREEWCHVRHRLRTSSRATTDAV